MGGGSSKSKKKLPPKGAASTSVAPAPVPKAPPIPSLLALNSARWEAESRSDPGFGSEEDDNQDVVLVDHLEELGAFVVGVFDGHGPSGRQVAQTCRAHLCDAIRKYVPSGEVGEACDWLERCFQSLENRVRRDLSDRLAESGAAGTVLVYLPARKLLYAANVGDSKAILIDATTPIESLTVDHFPSVANERKRIVAAGGRVAASDDVQLGELGEMRVWKGEDTIPGLTISRSIGDLIAKEVGVIATPSTQRIDFSANASGSTKLVVVGSSGIWKVFSPTELMNILTRETSVAAAADRAITEARHRWEELWQGENMSIVVFVLPG